MFYSVICDPLQYLLIKLLLAPVKACMPNKGSGFWFLNFHECSNQEKNKGTNRNLVTFHREGTCWNSEGQEFVLFWAAPMLHLIAKNQSGFHKPFQHIWVFLKITKEACDLCGPQKASQKWPENTSGSICELRSGIPPWFEIHS